MINVFRTSNTLNVAAVLLAIILISGCISEDLVNQEIEATESSIKEAIKTRLIGIAIEYTNIAGDTMSHVVSESDIINIEKVDLDGQIAWKVRIGDSMSWDYYFDEFGLTIIKTEQLFVT